MGNYNQTHTNDYEKVSLNNISNTEKITTPTFTNSNYKIKNGLFELCNAISANKKDISDTCVIKKIINDCPEVSITSYQNKFKLYPLNILFNGESKYNTDVILKILLENNFIAEPGCKSTSNFLISVNSIMEPCIKLFLEYGSDPNYRNKFGETPLMIIYKNGIHDTVYNITKLLIIKGANVNLCNKNNSKNIIYYNVLSSISRNIDFTKTLKLLLDNGADSNYFNKYNSNVLFSAMQFVEPTTNINILIKIFQLLIKYKLDVNAVNSYSSLLGRVCKINHPEKQKLILLLLENAADISMYSKQKNTPPFFFLLDGNSEPIKDILQLFIERKADFNHINNEDGGFTFLMKLVKTSRDKDTDDSIKMLLELGLVDPNIKGKNGITTALQIASENCLTSSSQTTIDILLEYGAV
jgi:ankyrin repeat protein